jgi:hypothetical protein
VVSHEQTATPKPSTIHNYFTKPNKGLLENSGKYFAVVASLWWIAKANPPYGLVFPALWVLLQE